MIPTIKLSTLGLSYNAYDYLSFDNVNKHHAYDIVS